jgi:hypothetical protein
MFKVEKFKYNGFYVEPLKGHAKYTAEFKSWTTDPGIALCICSDKKERLIPSCCLMGDKSSLPKQEKTGVLFGQQSKS